MCLSLISIINQQYHLIYETLKMCRHCCENNNRNILRYTSYSKQKQTKPDTYRYKHPLLIQCYDYGLSSYFIFQ